MNARRWWGVGIAAVVVGGIGLFVFRHPAASEAPSAAGPAAVSKMQPAEPKAPESASAKALLAQAERARTQGSFLEAKQLYQQILEQNPVSEVATTAQQRIGEVNLKLILSPVATPDAAVYTVQPGDTLSKIARQFHTTVELLKISNGLSNDRIRPDQRLKVAKALFSLIVDKSQNTLMLKNNEQILKVYRCATGEGGNTPVGAFKIVNRIVDPPWYSPNGVIPPGDPRNALGSRWLGFDQPGYGIHGTTDPDSIGKSITHGCVRLNNADVEELFALLPEGTQVLVVD